MDAACARCNATASPVVLDLRGRCPACAPCATCPDCGHAYQPADGSCPCHAEAAERAASRAPGLREARLDMLPALAGAVGSALAFTGVGRRVQTDASAHERVAELDRARADLAQQLASLDTALAPLRVALAHDPETRGPR